MYPATWARMHGRGRVFYTSMGHREDVWANPIFLNLLAGALDWITGRVEADTAPNFARVSPEGGKMPPPPPPPPAKKKN
jgi:type 1 glutamine amidotransferase